MELRPWRYPKGTVLSHKDTGRHYVISAGCQKFESGKYGYTVKDKSGRLGKVTLDEIIVLETYSLASQEQGI